MQKDEKREIKKAFLSGDRFYFFDGRNIIFPWKKHNE